MGTLTQDRPKCLLEVGGKSLLQHQAEAYRAAQINEICVVRGFRKEKITDPSLRYFSNPTYRENNILHSLMCAEPAMKQAFCASYSDILISTPTVARMAHVQDDIAIAVDTNWQTHYEGRTEHPVSEAESVLYDEDGYVLQIGKHLTPDQSPGEFIGMMKCSAKGAARFCEAFAMARKHFDRKPFMRAQTFERAYLTDFIQYLVDRGEAVRCIPIAERWWEIDTEQDLERAREEWQEIHAG